MNESGVYPTMSAPASPLLDPGTSPLDVRQRAVVQRVSDAERAHVLALPSNDPLDPKLHSRVEATGPELFGQPAAIQATLQLNTSTLDEIADRLTAGVRRVVLVGCGDSLAVMIAARQTLESMLGVPCEPMQSLEFAYYHANLVDTGTAVVALSSSGETTRTVEALLLAQHRRSYTVALTNTAGSTLQSEADTSLEIKATRVGWPTQSSTAALALLLELAIRVGERRVPTTAAPLREAFDEVPDVMAGVLSRIDPLIAKIAEDEVEAGVHTVLFSGGGPNLAAMKSRAEATSPASSSSLAGGSSGSGGTLAACAPGFTPACGIESGGRGFGASAFSTARLAHTSTVKPFRETRARW